MPDDSKRICAAVSVQPQLLFLDLRLRIQPSNLPGMPNAPCWIRTNDRLLRRQLLYPAELREQGGADASALGIVPVMP